MVLSLEPVAMYSAELLAGGGFFSPASAAKWEYATGGAIATHSITCSWPTKVTLASPELASHMRAVWSLPADTSHRPSKLGATSRTQSACPRIVLTQ
jgi:hypothetical protein